MSRLPHGIEKGLRIFLENSDTSVDILAGTGVPTGLGDQLNAAIGSLYIRIGTGELYQKVANVGEAADYVLNGAGSSSLLPIFSDKVVRAATGDVLGAGDFDPTAFSDNESAIDFSDFAIGEFVIGGVGGTPVLYEVTAISDPDITLAVASPAMADNQGFIVRAYLPDSPANQENTAGVLYQDGSIIKLFDVDWSVATAISLSSAYSPTNGVVAIGNSVENAIEKLVGNQDDIQTTLGVSQGSVDLGTFTGATIADNRTAKQALQDLESAHEEVDQNVNDLIALSGVAENVVNNGAMDQGDILSDNATTNALLKETDAELTRQRGKTSAAGVTTAVTLDSVLVDDVANAQWLVTVEKQSAPANKSHLEIFAGHNGHAAADASSVDDTIFSKLKQGSNFNVTVSVDLSGAAGAQVMRLRVASTEPGGVNVYAKRIETLF